MADSVCSSSLRMLSWVVKVVPQPPEPKKSEEQKDAAPPPAPAPPPAAAPPPVTVSFAQLKNVLLCHVYGALWGRMGCLP